MQPMEQLKFKSMLAIHTQKMKQVGYAHHSVNISYHE